MNSTSTKPLDSPLVLFIDECLGEKKVPNALRAAGADVVVLTDVFASGTKDPEWLSVLARKDWLVLTKDKNIRRHALAVESYRTLRLRVFVMTATDLTGDEVGAIYVKALPKIRRFCDTHAAPFIAAITGMSEVVILKTR